MAPKMKVETSAEQEVPQQGVDTLPAVEQQAVKKRRLILR